MITHRGEYTLRPFISDLLDSCLETIVFRELEAMLKVEAQDYYQVLPYKSSRKKEATAKVRIRLILNETK